MIDPRALQQRRRRCRRIGLSGVVFILLPAAFCPGALAAVHTGSLPAFQSDFGGVGLMQTPTARMAKAGAFSFHYDQIDPYTNYAFSLQPFSWLEAGFRYTTIGNRNFNAFTRNRSYLDKGVNVKIALWQEHRYLPRVAFGFRDFGGTGLFGGEYVVANKRWYGFDFSLGLGWGYLGTRGDIQNPLAVFGNRFKNRDGRGGNGTGKFNVNQLFTGRPSFFGGIQYQTPFKPLTLQFEYEGNDYTQEPLGDNQKQDLPVNMGARLQLTDNLSLAAAWERGNTVMFGGTLSLNFADIMQPKSDPPPVVPGPTPATATTQWGAAASELADNAGIGVTRISRQGRSLVIDGVPTKYRSLPEAELRANRVLQNAAGPDITSFKYRWRAGGFYLREDALPRDPLPTAPLLVAPGSPFTYADYRYGVVSSGLPKGSDRLTDANTLYNTSPRTFSYNIRPGYNQNYGGPDGYLYQILLRADAELSTDDNGFFSGTLAYTLLDNFNNFKYIGPSQLPRVRTYIGKYLDQTTVGLYNLQYTRTARLADNWFGMGFAGYLEMMYAGAGGEVLYRPFNSPIALGFDAEWVKQRDFNTGFGLRNYSTVVGNATIYWDTGIAGVLAQVSGGRYLAKDYGSTIDLSRQFKSGVRVGAYATFTTAGNKYGEGSFDKGIYISMPLDIFFTRSTRSTATIGWSPLTRDGGARLNRRYSLYNLTDSRSLHDYWRGFQDTNQ